jgi:hypothetical protein
MSKKKNTLKDLDDFLKQQAASLVQPTPLSERVEEQEVHTPASTVSRIETEAELISTKTILEDIKILSEQEGSAFRSKFYDLIIESIESQPSSQPEDKMLINTALYLKSGNRWKDTIRAYWKSKNH